MEKSEKIIHHSSGAVTFGIKYKEQKPDDIPGNNWFKICGTLLYVNKISGNKFGKNPKFSGLST